MRKSEDFFLTGEQSQSQILEVGWSYDFQTGMVWRRRSSTKLKNKQRNVNLSLFFVSLSKSAKTQRQIINPTLV